MSYVWVILAALFMTAFFSAAEMAFLGANRIRLRHLAEGGHRVAGRYLEAFSKPGRLLSAAKMGVPAAHIVASTVATWALLPSVGPAAALIVTLVLTPVMLVLGEVIPKAIAQQWATGLILRLFRPLTWAAWLLAPLALVAWAQWKLSAAGEDPFRAFFSAPEHTELTALRRQWAAKDQLARLQAKPAVVCLRNGPFVKTPYILHVVPLDKGEPTLWWLNGLARLRSVIAN